MLNELNGGTIIMYEQLENLRHRDYLYPGMSDSDEEWYLGYNSAIDEIQEIDEASLSSFQDGLVVLSSKLTEKEK